MTQTLYERYSLSSNPFVEGKHDFPMIDRKIAMSKIARVMRNLAKSDSPQFVFLLGDYGMGKTYTLLQVKSKLEAGSSGFPPASENYVVYAKMLPPKPPSDYLVYLYSQIVSGLGRATFEEFSRLRQKTDNADLEANFDRALSKLSSSDAAWMYLCGQTISRNDSKELEITGRIARDTDAWAALLSVLRLVRLARRRSILVLVDEFEYLLTAAGDKRAAQIITTFKDLLDRLSEMDEKLAYPIFLIASTPGVYHNIPDLAEKVGLGGVTPFLKRIYTTIPLDPFTEAETKQLLITRLERRRIGKGEGSTSPFKPDFVSFITKRCQGNPRDILHYCAIILDEADAKGLESIGMKEAKSIVESLSLP